MTETYVIRGVEKPSLTIFVCLIFTVLGTACVWLATYVWMFAGVFDSTSVIIGGIGVLCLVAVVPNALKVMSKRLTI